MRSGPAGMQRRRVPWIHQSQSRMTIRTHASAGNAFDTAWALFCQLHDSPSLEQAGRLVHWLGEDPGHVRAFDEVLTLWALTGVALVEPMLEEAQSRGADLQ